MMTNRLRYAGRHGPVLPFKRGGPRFVQNPPRLECLVRATALETSATDSATDRQRLATSSAVGQLVLRTYA